MLNAIIPIFLLIIVGYLIKHSPFLRDSFWGDAEKLAYYLLFPSLLISKVSTADLSQVDPMPLILAISLLMATVSLLTFLIKPFLGISNASFTSVYQGSIRFNTYIGLAIVNSLFDKNGLVLAVIIAAIWIPILNLLLVFVLQAYSSKHSDKRLSQTLKNLVTNPLIVGCLIGIGINISNLSLPFTVFKTLDLLGSTALPIGLLSVGAAFTFQQFRSSLTPIFTASTIKLILSPIIALLLANHLGLEQQTQQIFIIFSALPSASAAYILAKNMGGDFQLMAKTITLQTLLSVATILLVLQTIAK